MASPFDLCAGAAATAAAMCAELHRTLHALCEDLPAEGDTTQRAAQCLRLVVSSAQQMQEAADALAAGGVRFGAVRRAKLDRDAQARELLNQQQSSFVSALVACPEVFDIVCSIDNMFLSDRAAVRSCCRASRRAGASFVLLLNSTGASPNAPKVCLVQPRGVLVDKSEVLPSLRWTTPSLGKISQPHVVSWRSPGGGVCVVYRGKLSGTRKDGGKRVAASGRVALPNSGPPPPLTFQLSGDDLSMDPERDSAVPHLHTQLQAPRVRLLQMDVGDRGCCRVALLKACEGLAWVVAQTDGAVDKVCSVPKATTESSGPWCGDIFASVLTQHEQQPPSCVTIRATLLSGPSKKLLNRICRFSAAALVAQQKMRASSYPCLPCPREDWDGGAPRSTAFFGHYVDCRGRPALRQIRAGKSRASGPQGVKLSCQLVAKAGGAVLRAWQTTVDQLDYKRSTGAVRGRDTYTIDVGPPKGCPAQLRVYTDSIGIVDASSDAVHALDAFAASQACVRVCCWEDHQSSAAGGSVDARQPGAGEDGPLWFLEAQASQDGERPALCVAHGMQEIFDHMACHPAPESTVHCYFLAGTTVARLAVPGSSATTVPELVESVRELLHSRGVFGVSVAAPGVEVPRGGGGGGAAAAGGQPLTVGDLQHNLHNPHPHSGVGPSRPCAPGHFNSRGQLIGKLERLSEEIENRTAASDPAAGDQRMRVTMQSLQEAVGKQAQAQAQAGGSVCVLIVTPWAARRVCVLDTPVGEHCSAVELTRGQFLRLRALDCMCQSGDGRTKPQFKQISAQGALEVHCAVPPVCSWRAKPSVLVGQVREWRGELALEEVHVSTAEHFNNSTLTANSVLPLGEECV